jgi:hypothetical protein
VQKNVLSGENLHLRTNISRLYTTAVQEAKRKDRTIAELRQQIREANKTHK